MAICATCGHASARVRSRWDEKGVRLPDECHYCAPQNFEKFTAPSDKKIWMGFEANPNEYEKRYDSEGVFYIRKPEYRTEQEEKLMQPAADEAEKQRLAEEKKRKERRTLPMDPAETLAAIAKAKVIADAMQQEAMLVN